MLMEQLRIMNQWSPSFNCTHIKLQPSDSTLLETDTVTFTRFTSVTLVAGLEVEQIVVDIILLCV